MNDTLAAPNAPVTERELVTLVELLFFAYRDFTAEPDAILAQHGLGRAHHRVLHFVRRHPGLSVSELLSILNITKQSLARVLRPLVADGWIDSRTGPDDRRERLLYVTHRGETLADELAQGQSERVRDALIETRASMAAKLGPADGHSADAAVMRFLFAMIGEHERRDVAAMLKLAL